MSSYTNYLQMAQRSIKKTFPFELQVDSYRVDGCGDVIDENGDFLKNKYLTLYFDIKNDDDLNEVYCGLNPHGHYRFIQL